MCRRWPAGALGGAGPGDRLGQSGHLHQDVQPGAGSAVLATADVTASDRLGSTAALALGASSAAARPARCAVSGAAPRDRAVPSDRPARDRAAPEPSARDGVDAPESVWADESVVPVGDAQATPALSPPAAAPIPSATAKPPTLPTNTDARTTIPPVVPLMLAG